MNLPNWLPLAFRIDGGPWFDVRAVELLEYRQELDPRGGILIRHVRFRNRDGFESTVTQRRFVHMDDAHVAGLETSVVAENWSGRLDVRSELDGTVVNAGSPGIATSPTGTSGSSSRVPSTTGPCAWWWRPRSHTFASRLPRGRGRS